MCGTHEEHAQARLADAATDGEWKFVLENSFMEWREFHALAQFQLFAKRPFINALFKIGFHTRISPFRPRLSFGLRATSEVKINAEDPGLT